MHGMNVPLDVAMKFLLDRECPEEITAEGIHSFTFNLHCQWVKITAKKEGETWIILSCEDR